jgi:N-acetylneuraminic acid mutarotase
MKKYLLFIVAFFLNAIIIYGQAPNTWMQKADFVGGTRSFPAGFSIGGKAYIGTGNNGILNTKDFWEYDPITNIWTRKTDFPGNARTSAVGFAIGNKGYIGSGDGGYYGPYYHDFWEYDPATDKWTKIADFPGEERHFATGFAIETKGYFGAGANTSGTDIYYNDFWEYDPVMDKWTRKADFGGGGRSNPAGFSIGNKGYIGCGWSYGWQRDFWQYDPATDKWTRKADFGGASREYVNAVGFSISGKGYLGTGYAGSVFRDFWQYDPENNLWTRVADFGGVGRSTAIGFSIGDKGYLGTGNNGTTVYKDYWEYTPRNNITAIPTITSFSPASGPISSTLTITGTNFSENASDNIVYFGAVRAVVATATASKLKVYVPVGTTYQSISVTTKGLTAFSAKPFVVTFEEDEEIFTQHSFAPKKDIPLGYNPCGSYIRDFDGDGRTDLVTGDFNSSIISVLRNTSHAGSVSFEQKKNFTAGNGNRSCTAGDLDGDGKPEIVTVNINANTISVLRNTSTVGNMSFAPKIDFTTGNSPGYAVIRDLDGDGKPEIIVTNFVSATFSVFRNTSSVGNISFDTRKDFTTALGNFNCAISDLNGDGKPDMVVGTEAPSTVFSVFQNTSTPGNIW